MLLPSLALVLAAALSRVSRATSKTASISYPEYIPDDATCIIQLDGTVDVDTVLGSDAVFMGIPNFYTIPCFSSEESEEPDIDAYDTTDDNESMTYEEKVAALDEIAARAGVVAVYPDISLSIKVPATLSNYTAARCSVRKLHLACARLALVHNWRVYCTG